MKKVMIISVLALGSLMQVSAQVETQPKPNIEQPTSTETPTRKARRAQMQKRTPEEQQAQQAERGERGDRAKRAKEKFDQLPPEKQEKVKAHREKMKSMTP